MPPSTRRSCACSPAAASASARACASSPRAARHDLAHRLDVAQRAARRKLAPRLAARCACSMNGARRRRTPRRPRGELALRSSSSSSWRAPRSSPTTARRRRRLGEQLGVRGDGAAEVARLLAHLDLVSRFATAYARAHERLDRRPLLLGWNPSSSAPGAGTRRASARRLTANPSGAGVHKRRPGAVEEQREEGQRCRDGRPHPAFLTQLLP